MRLNGVVDAMRSRLILAVTAVPLLLASCGDDTATIGTDPPPPPVTEPSTPTPNDPATPTSAPTTNPVGPLAEVAALLADAEGRWAAAGQTTYSMELRTVCFCPDHVTRVDVVDGAVVSARNAGDGVDDPNVEPAARTVEDLFDELRRAIDDGADQIVVTFDESTGRPVSYWVDVDEGTADEEYGVDVTEFTSTTSMAGTDWFVTALPCGHGFAATSADQSLILDIRWTNVLSLADAPISIDAEVPDRDWMGEIRVGSDLAANWCDDVIEEGEPTPRTDERWDVTAGRLVAASDPADPGVVSGTITGLEVTTDDGTVLSLGNIELENLAWGVYAG